jgi:aryl-alcohol dehydrogenase-like predicted oxidoreductase
MAEALEIAVTPWGALGGGVLTGKYAGGKAPPDARYAEGPWGAIFLTERNLRIGAVLAEVARGLGRTPSQVALAWLRSCRRGTIIPILGARTVAQLRDNLGCLDLELPRESLARLDAASRVDLGFPHDFLELDVIRNLLHGQIPVEGRRRC